MLDFASLAAQMEKMLDEGRIRPDALPVAVAAAHRICARCDSRGDFNAMILQARETGRVPDRWHPARLLEGGLLCGTRPSPALPSSYLVVASDGSQIYPDAHQIADCFLLHISGVALRYGITSHENEESSRMSTHVEETALNAHKTVDALHMSTHAAREEALNTDKSVDAPDMSTHARREDDGAIDESEDNALMRATPYFGHGASDDAWQRAARLGAGAANREMVDARRHVAELDELAALLESAPPQFPAVGLCDGIFDLRVSQQQPWRELAQQENARALDALRQCGQPIGGYIAASRATDVVTALRLVLREIARGNDEETCDDETAENCVDLMKSEVDEALSVLIDARLFDVLLQEGERSATFVADRGDNRGLSSGMSTHTSTHARGEGDGARHATCFFYLKSESGEVARIEFPRWVAERADWLDRLHAVVLAQIERGDGYPVALMEAHEHAVVRGSERELFYQLLEEMMTARGIAARRSPKALSKGRPLV